MVEFLLEVIYTTSILALTIYLDVTPVINLWAGAAGAKKDCFQITSGTEFISPECRVGMAVGYSIRDRNVWYPSASVCILDLGRRAC
jgi:hypothetical protein